MAALANGIFFSLGPLFGASVGMNVQGVALFMSLVILGGVALQWPIGHLSDTHDRRSVILGAALGGALTAALAAMTVSPVAFYMLAFLYGGFTFSLYPLCIAHGNDQVPAAELMRTASGLLLIYGVGATVGPFLIGWLMTAFGSEAFFVTLMTLHLTLGVYTIYRRHRRPALPATAKEPFVMLSRTSQSALEMLPASGTGTVSPEPGPRTPLDGDA
jgi:MFS family permease